MTYKQVDELLICEKCGARIALGKYAPLSRVGKISGCSGDSIIVNSAEADEMLRAFQARKAQP